MNRIILVGRLTREPEMRYTSTGKEVANFTLAVDRSRPNAAGEKEADLIRITVWGKGAENCSIYLGKGSMVAVDGRLQISKYVDKEGQNRTSTDVVAERVQFLDRKKDAGGGCGGTTSSGDNEAHQGDDLGFGGDEPPF